MARFLVLIRPVALALTVPSLAFSQAATPAPPTEPSSRTFLAELADDVRRLPSNPVAVSVTLGATASSSNLPLDDFFTGWQPNDAFESGTWIGNGVVLATGTLLTYAIGRPVLEDQPAAPPPQRRRVRCRPWSCRWMDERAPRVPREDTTQRDALEEGYSNLTGVRPVTNVRRNS